MALEASTLEEASRLGRRLATLRNARDELRQLADIAPYLPPAVGQIAISLHKVVEVIADEFAETHRTEP